MKAITAYLEQGLLLGRQFHVKLCPVAQESASTTHCTYLITSLSVPVCTTACPVVVVGFPPVVLEMGGGRASRRAGVFFLRRDCCACTMGLQHREEKSFAPTRRSVFEAGSNTTCDNRAVGGGVRPSTVHGGMTRHMAVLDGQDKGIVSRTGKRTGHGGKGINGDYLAPGPLVGTEGELLVAKPRSSAALTVKTQASLSARASGPGTGAKGINETTKRLGRVERTRRGETARGRVLVIGLVLKLWAGAAGLGRAGELPATVPWSFARP